MAIALFVVAIALSVLVIVLTVAVIALVESLPAEVQERAKAMGGFSLTSEAAGHASALGSESAVEVYLE